MKKFSTAWTVVFLYLMVTGASGLAGQSLELISKADPVPDSNGRPGELKLSADGRYAAFISEAPNLAPGQVDDNFFFDVFLHDRVTDTTTLVSHAAGSPNRAGRPDLSLGPLSLDLQISADGRYVAFVSLATDLMPGVTDTNQVSDVYLWDRVTGTTTLVSHVAGSPNVPADGFSYDIRLSADGRYLAFNSAATNLVEGQTDPEQSSGVFLWDRATSSSALVSRKSGTNATEADDESNIAGISADGETVLFTSTAQDLLPNSTDTPRTTDVFLYQRSSRTVTLVSRASGAPGTAVGGYAGALSADGLYVAFVSAATNLVPGQVDGVNNLDMFLFDRISREVRLVSRTSLSPQMAGGEVHASFSTDLAISADGRFVAFAGQAANLVPGQVDTNQSADLFVYDRLTGTTALASHTSGSTATAGTGTTRSYRPSFSADGRFLTFASPATNLVLNQTDANALDDVFLYDTSTQATVLLSHAGGSAFTAANGESTSPVISADGGIVGFFSRANNLGEGQADPNNFFDLFLYRRPSGEITSASRRDPGEPMLTPHGPSIVEGFSADGRYALFSSRATGLMPGQIDVPDRIDALAPRTTGTWDVFLRDQTLGKNILLSRSLTSKVTAVGGFSPILSADGRFAAFITSRNTPPLGFRIDLLYLYDRVSDTLTLVSHKPGSAEESDGFIFEISLSADGRFLTYACAACELVPGYFRDPNGSTFTDIYLYDRTTGANTLVSHVPGSTSTGGDHNALFSRISADGRFVVFASQATNLVPGQIDTSFPLSYDLFVFNRMTGAVTLASRTAASAVTAAGITRPGLGLSADGRFIAFHSGATNLVPGQVDTNEGTDLFLHDRVSGATVLVSHAASSPVTAGNGPSHFPFSVVPLPDSTISMSAEGRFLVYESTAANLVAGAADTDTSSDVFLYDRLSGTNTLVSRALATGQQAQYPHISADGSRIAFLGTDPFTRRRDVYGHERSTGKTTLIAPGHEFFYGTTGGSERSLPLSPHLSADGRRIAFTTDAPLVKGDFNGLADAYLWSDGFVTLPNCKLLDTRRRADRPILTSNVQRTVTARGVCGVPATAKQVIVKVTALSASGKGNLRFYPGAVTATPSGILRFERNATRTETFTLPLSTNGALTILPFVAGNGTVHGVVEVTGYAN